MKEKYEEMLLKEEEMKNNQLLAEKYKQAFEKIEERIQCVIQENEKMNEILPTKIQECEQKQVIINDIEEKLKVMIDENDKLNDLL